jgi:zinc transport system substrate-binding protein
MQPQFSKKSAEIVAAEIGGEVAFADDLAYDWPANLLQVAEKIKKAGK